MQQRLATANNNKAKAKKENARAIQAFEDYYTLLGSSRSLEKLADVYQNRTEASPTKQLSTLKQWSRKYGWQSQVLERMQAELEAKRQADAQEAAELRKRLNRKRLQVSARLIRSGMKIVRQADIENMGSNAAQMQLSNAVKMITEGIKAERLEVGESTENMAVQIIPPKALEDMSDVELDEYIYRLKGIS